MAARAGALLLLLSARSASAYDYAWDATPYYLASLPAQGTSSCCGSQIVGDPATQTSSPACLCDLTAGACDDGCCCDLDCSPESLKLDGVFGCTSNGTAVQPKGYTVCSDQLVAANLPQSVQEQSLVTSFGGANGLLCVVADNSPARGAFFRDPVATTALTAPQVVAQIDAALPVQYGVWTGAPAVAAAAVAATYALGAPVLANAAPVSAVMLPAPSADGTCGASQSISFLRDVAPFACGLVAPSASAPTASTLEALCATTLNASFVRGLSFRSAPVSGSAAAAFDVATLDVNASSGDSWAVGTAAGVPSSVWDASAGVCSSALTIYQLRLTVSDEGTVQSARAYLGLASLTAADVPSARLWYGAQFEYAGEASTLSRPTSGRPGYVRGLPLVLAEGTSVRTGGLELLPRTARGACATTSTSRGATPVLFGEDLAVSCTVSQTAEELRQACLYPPALADQPLIASLNVSAATLVGVYGDSHPSTTADWVPLSLRYPQNDARQVVPTWDPASQTCANVLSSLHLRVLFTEVGSTTNPIRKVVGAELVFGARSVQAASCALGGGASSCPPTVTTITATATFAKLESTEFAFIPEAPQLIPPLPYDFFYPFFMSSNPAR